MANDLARVEPWLLPVFFVARQTVLRGHLDYTVVTEPLRSADGRVIRKPLQHSHL